MSEQNDEQISETALLLQVAPFSRPELKQKGKLSLTLL